MDLSTARLDTLTALRFFAALFVVVFHGWYAFTGLQGVSGAGPVQFGYTSVGFFFMLSGFVLAWTWRPGTGIPALWWRRVVRIFPLCALLTVGVALYYLEVPGAAPVGQPLTWGSFLTCFFLLQAWPPFPYLNGYNFPSWSLSTEMFFYFVFPFLALWLAIVRVRHHLLVTLAVLLGAAYIGSALWLYQRKIYSLTPGSMLAFPPLQLLKFAAGVCVGTAFRQGWRPKVHLWQGVLLVLGLLALMPTLTTIAGPKAVLRSTELFPDLVLVFPFTFLVAAAAASDLRGGTLLGRWRFMVRLGDWSFALYLVQAPVLFVSYQMRIRTGHPGPPGWWGLAVYVVACVALSGLLYHLYERPIERRLRPLIAVRT
ncbi:MAG TPA: acyltransferase [Candidatus Dormibacteraeota bacterium]|jgi:peptidoglycan/LPS O-acetylase OafA/YrhL